MKIYSYILVFLLSFLGMTATASAIQFECGRYDYSASVSPGSNLGTTATAFFASPGIQYDPVALTYASPWWLSDQLGSGALMGCQPKLSGLRANGGARENTYVGANLTSQLVSTAQGPVTLNYTYDAQNRVRTSEALCFSGAVNTLKVQMTWTYSGDVLDSVAINGPDGCSFGPFPIQVFYSYGSAIRLPTTVNILQGGTVTETHYAYTVASGVVSQVTWNSPYDGTEYSIKYHHIGTVLDRFIIEGGTAPTGIYNQTYNPNGQWLSSITPSNGWGLHLTYNAQNLVSTACNDTGWPGVDACANVGAHFFYDAPAKKEK